jgi:hypothetical protein
MKEKIAFKMGACGVLAALAVVMSASALSEIQPKSQSPSDSVQSVADSETYVLKEYEGYVGIYIKGETRLPITVTDIEVRTLPEADQNAIMDGLDVEGKENLMMILEDLGS